MKTRVHLKVLTWALSIRCIIYKIHVTCGVLGIAFLFIKVVISWWKSHRRVSVVSLKVLFGALLFDAFMNDAVANKFQMKKEMYYPHSAITWIIPFNFHISPNDSEIFF